MADNQPTHDLCVKEREGDGRGKIGAAWLWADGSVTIKLNPCVILQSTDNVTIKLFPRGGYKKRSANAEPNPPPPADDDHEMPF